MEYVIMGVPTAVFVWFIVTLIVFLATPKANIEKRKRLKPYLIASGVISAVFACVILTLLILISISIQNM
ncbi:MAG: hypothetical protein Q4F95_01335 [Oscillospiraceae bacterium]|nr:hypothetical protein [Oscillospiraceae bacterium]